MSSIFSQIIQGKIPSHCIAEDDRFYAFLDINPLVMGHTLVIPKEEVDYIFDLDDETLQGMIVFAKRVATGISHAIPSLKVGLGVIGLEVPHAHIHLVPMQSEEDMHFGRKKLSPSQEDLKATADKIRQALSSP